VLTRGLVPLALGPGRLRELIPLQLAATDLAAAKASLSTWADPQPAEALAALRGPYSDFYDYDLPWSLAALRALCDAAGLALPPPAGR
jgi:hypothetical protein